MTAAYGYFRLSTDEGEAIGDASSTVLQEKKARDVAQEHGWEYVESFDEGDGCKGDDFSDKGRPQLARLRSSLKSMPAGSVLIVRDQDRLSRGTMGQTFTLLEEIEAHGIRVYNYTDRNYYDSRTLAGQMGVFMRAASATQETEKARSRTTFHHEAHATNGHPVAGWCIGYRVIRVLESGEPCPKTEHKKCCVPTFQIVDDQRPLIERIYREIASGLGTKTLALKLMGEGIRGPRGKGWEASVLRKLIRRRLYRGEMVYTIKGKTQKVYRDSWRIVSDEQWQAANDKLDARSADFARTTDGRLIGHPDHVQHLLGGFNTCSVCGGGFFAKGAAPSCYACTIRHKKSDCTNAKTLPETLADQAVITELSDRILTLPVFKRTVEMTLARVATKPADTERQRKAIEAEIRKAEQEVANFEQAIADGLPVRPETFKAATRKLNDLKARLEHLDGLSLAAPKLDSVKVEEQIRARLAEWQDQLQGNTTKARQILRKLINGRITWTPTPEGYHFKATATYGKLLEGIVITRQPRGDGGGRRGPLR